MRVPKRRGEEFAKQKKTHDPYLSQAAIKKMKKQLEDLKKNQRPPAIKEMQRTAEDGDFSENAAYQDAKHRLRRINSRITSLEERLKTAIPITATRKDGTIQIGSTVLLYANDRQYEYQILGSQEADILKGKISHASPLGAALINHKAGEEITLKTNGQETTFQILNVQ